MKTASEAFALLTEGNQRFITNRLDDEVTSKRWPRENFVDQQRPHTVVVGCSDSRVPVELVFDQGLGDLFVVRVAGNIVAPSQMGSVEYAASQLGTRLVIVLGHTGCGAINATINNIQQPDGPQSPNILSIVNLIRPNIASLVVQDDQNDPASLQNAAMQANVRASVQQLRENSPLLKDLMANEELRVVGAEYDVATGRVTFLDDELIHSADA